MLRERRSSASPTGSSHISTGPTWIDIREASEALRRHPHLPPRGHLRRGVRGLHALLLLHLRRRERAARHRASRRSSSSAAGRTASGRASSSTTAASTPRSRCASSASRPSWSTRTPRPSRPTTTPATNSTSSRSRSKTCSTSTSRSSENLFGVIVQFGGQTPLNLANGLARSRRSDHRHLAEEHRDRRGPQALRRDARQARHPPDRRRHRDERRRSRSPIAQRVGYPGARAPVVRARRPRACSSSTTNRISAATCALPSRPTPGARPVLVDHFLEDATEVDVDCISDGETVGHRRDHGAHRGGRHPQRRQRVRHPAVLALAKQCKSRNHRARRKRWRAS